MQTIGTLDGNFVELGSTQNGEAYKNFNAFQDKSEDICYIPEHGVEWDESAGKFKIVSSYTYSDFLEMGEDIAANYPTRNLPHKIAQIIFFLCQWQDPHTIIEEDPEFLCE